MVIPVVQIDLKQSEHHVRPFAERAKTELAKLPGFFASAPIQLEGAFRFISNVREIRKRWLAFGMPVRIVVFAYEFQDHQRRGN